jgi:beta-glucosidase
VDIQQGRYSPILTGMPFFRFDCEPALLAGVFLVFSNFHVPAAERGCPCDNEKQPALVLALNNSDRISDGEPGAHSAKYTDVPPYLDPGVPIEQRIDDLLPRLTLEEKVIQLSDNWGSPGIPRLKIPALLKTEGLHSQSYSSGATIFPVPIAMATTFDPELISRVGKAIGSEAKAANLRASWSPVLDVARDARWGRVEETYGEDPFLVSRMGVAWINGFQSLGMIAVPKHFAGHGEPLGGRDSNDTGLSERTMREIHLAPFRAAIQEARAGGVMAAYSTWNGVPCNASIELVQKILREEWGFDGIVVSDCGGPENFLNKQSVATELAECCRLAILAGINSECGSAFNKALAATVRSGVLKESDLDPNLRAILRAKFKLGLFENPGPQQMVWDKLPAYDTPEHRALAREVAVQGAVLLKNDGKLLPLSKDIKAIAVIGPDADQAQLGDYSPKPVTNQLVTVLQGIKSHVGAGTTVLYAKGCDVLHSNDTSAMAQAVQFAKQADAVILVIGDHSYPDKQKSTTGENVDGATLEIPGAQRELIRQIHAVGKPVVLVLVNGKPFTLAWEAREIPAILETWYPGEEGGNATAELIFGERNPSGKLPITFPRGVGQLPLHYNYLPSGRGYAYYDMPFTPLYRFGHGLSYTSFKYQNLAAKVSDSGTVTVSAEIENTGDRDGDEVAQLYVTDLLTSVITPVIELKGFKRIALKKGERKTVVFELAPYQLSFLNADMSRVVEPSRFRVHVGGVCPEPPPGGDRHKLKIGFNDPAEGVTGEFEVTKAFKADFNCTLTAPAQIESGKTFEASVTVTNEGNLLDVANIKLYGERLLDSHRFEIPPKAARTYKFEVALKKPGQQSLTVVLGSKIFNRNITVSQSTANLRLENIHPDKESAATDEK